MARVRAFRPFVVESIEDIKQTVRRGTPDEATVDAVRYTGTYQYEPDTQRATPANILQFVADKSGNRNPQFDVGDVLAIYKRGYYWNVEGLWDDRFDEEWRRRDSVEKFQANRNSRQDNHQQAMSAALEIATANTDNEATVEYKRTTIDCAVARRVLGEGVYNQFIAAIVQEIAREDAKIEA